MVATRSSTLSSRYYNKLKTFQDIEDTVFPLGFWCKIQSQVMATKKELTPEQLSHIELKEEIRHYVLDNPDESTTEVARLFNVHKMTVVALKYWASVKKGQVIHKTQYTNADGIKKQQAREEMISAIMNSGITKGDVLTLPFSTCAIEKQMPRNKFRYLGCERDEDVYYEMLSTIIKEKLKMNTFLGDIGEKIYEAKPDQYAHLILDYCGQISSSQEEIRHAIENNIVQVGGTISVTMCKRGEIRGTLAEKMDALPENFFKKSELQNNSIRAFFMEFAGASYKILKYMDYRDEGKMPMVLVILQRKA